VSCPTRREVSRFVFGHGAQQVDLRNRTRTDLAST
jgi:hypothetical protein